MMLKRAMTTLFWCGEPGDASNLGISNVGSYWCDDWVERFGGVDKPGRNWTPKENPFYFALPYGEYDDANHVFLKESATKIPWCDDSEIPLLKNRWIEIIYHGRSAYAQWEDVGPNNENDFAWVFGKSMTPKSEFNNHAGLDISPTTWKYLGMPDNDFTNWRFVDFDDVPEGPWSEIITKRGIE